MSKKTQPKCPINFKCLFHDNKIVKALRLFWGWDYHYCLCLLEKQSLKEIGKDVEFDDMMKLIFWETKESKETTTYCSRISSLIAWKNKKRKENIRKGLWHQVRFLYTNRSIMISTYHLILGNDLGCQKQSWRKCCSRWTSSFYQRKEEEHSNCLLSLKVSLTRNKEIWNSTRQ